MNEQQFYQAVNDLKITYTEKMMHQLHLFYELLIDWNQKMNLTRITEKEEVYLKHFYDSLTITKIVDLKEIQTMCDVGSGAGFPGIVLKIFYPHLKITLIDSLNKRVTYLNEVIKSLELTGIEAIHSRAEEFAKENYEKYDMVTARAVAQLRILSEICLPMVQVHGCFIVMKGNCYEEIEESRDTITFIGGKICAIEKFKLPVEGSSRTLLRIEKVHQTNRQYPRSIDKIKKIPLKKQK